MSTCPVCQHLSTPGAAFCEQCGARLAGAAGAALTPPEGQPTVPTAPPPGPPPVPPPITASTPYVGGPAPAGSGTGQPPWLVPLAVVLGVLAIGLVIWLVASSGDGGSGGEDFTSGGSTPQTVAPATSTTNAPATTSPPSNPTDPTDLPSGLLCRDLNTRGYNYAEAVAYWASDGRPDRMDEDRNGYPCETVYPTADVVAYWGFDPQAGDNGGGNGGVYDLPSGLFCRDLRARGFSYSDAVAYWNLEGQPSRMVARDLPCETVYPTADVVAYWNQFAD